jgi:hypothetical protein
MGYFIVEHRSSSIQEAFDLFHLDAQSRRFTQSTLESIYSSFELIKKLIIHIERNSRL